ncbi:hypothetical protein BGZ70_005221 [Mortierella alpina]|uniref:F-box domain-containing protein n=1 Tax=Mortierella alpina TaxID=64518 RepID=A0A9P6J9D0_MORAP|nr:hypothetical protein BGZ70_005221 [Mortierella alpina]
MAFNNNNNNNNNVGDNGNPAADAMDAMEPMDDMDDMDADVDQTALADLPPDTRVMTMPELAQHIIRYIPISSLQACSGINRMWRQLINPLPCAFRDYQTVAQEQFESGPRRIHILSYFVLQYGPSVHSMNNSANSYQFIFSCQARSGSVDSYGSTGSEGRRGGGGSSSGNYSGEGSSQSHLQRHHTHQPGHDLEPFRSFHTYQSSAIVPNVYFKTGFHPPPSHPSSPPPSLSSARPSTQPHHSTLQPNPAQQQAAAVQASVSVTQSASWQSIDQLLAHSSAHASDCTHHSYEGDVSTDSTSSIILDVSDMSLSPAQLQSSTLAAGLARQSPVLRVVPCPYEHTSDGSISYDSRGSHPTKKDSGTSSGSGNSHETSGTSGGTGDEAYLQGLNMVYSTVTASSSTATALPFPGQASASASSSSSSSTSSSYTTGLSPPAAYGQYAGSSSASRPHTEPARSRHGKERSIEAQAQLQAHHLVQHASHHLPGSAESSTDLSERMNLETTSGGDSSDPQPFLAGIEGVPGATASSSFGVTSTTTTSLHQRTNAPSASLRRTSSSSNTSSIIRQQQHHHHHHHHHHHQQHLQHHLQQQRPSRNWSMAVQTFYYMRAASNAMIAACRDHMHSSEGQGGHIVEKTDTSRIIWNEATRQEHIWTITPTLMDRTNPGDFVERDYDADADVETEQSRDDDTQGEQESG